MCYDDYPLFIFDATLALRLETCAMMFITLLHIPSLPLGHGSGGCQ
jgi:hypothetical protein